MKKDRIAIIASEVMKEKCETELLPLLRSQGYEEIQTSYIDSADSSTVYICPIPNKLIRVVDIETSIKLKEIFERDLNKLIKNA